MNLEVRDIFWSFVAVGGVSVADCPPISIVPITGSTGLQLLMQPNGKTL